MAAAQAVGHIGQAILMKSARQRHAQHGAECRRHQAAGQHTVSRPLQRHHHQRRGGCRAAANHPTDGREMRGAGTQHGRAVPNPLRQPPSDRDTREELQRQQEMAHAVHGAVAS